MINDLRIKQIMVFIIGAFLMLLVSPITTLAQTTSFEPLPANISQTSPVYSELIVSNLFHTLSCLAVGQSNIGQPCLNYQMTKDAQGIISSVPVLSKTNLSNGALGSLTSMIGGLYANPPVRTGDYVASVGKNLGFVKEANAQVVGSGANILAPILSLWTMSRNIAYLAMIIIFVVIGIMVMFRKKLNPQTVITAQSSLPGLVIGLILITFSYFMAGLIADTSFIGTNIVSYYFSSAVKSYGGKPNESIDFTNVNVLSLLARSSSILDWNKIDNTIDTFYKDLDNGEFFPWRNPQGVLRYFSSFIIGQALMPFGQLGGGLGQIASVVAPAAGTLFFPSLPITIVSWAFSMIVILMLLYAMFRLLLRLLNSYLMIIFLTITAPFHFLISSLPGKQGIATAWILNLLSNVLVFPAVFAVIYLAAFLSGQNIGDIKVTQSPGIMNAGAGIKTVFAQGPQISGEYTFPLIGGFDVNTVRALLAFAALLATPTIPDLVVQTFGRPGKAGGAVNQTVMGIFGAARGQGQGGMKGWQGMAGQVGSLRDTPAYYTDENGIVKSATGLSVLSQRLGARPGRASIMSTANIGIPFVPKAQFNVGNATRKIVVNPIKALGRKLGLTSTDKPTQKIPDSVDNGEANSLSDTDKS